MKERPILFSAPMVRAILDGRKSQTRRVAKPGKYPSLLNGEWPDSYVLDPGNREWLMRDCPYGAPGDRLWVRETWGLHLHLDYTYWLRDSVRGRSEEDLRGSYEIAYAADALSPYDHWRPSIHMPRWASRITLEIVSVRVERLQDISEEDAISEGIAPLFSESEVLAKPELAEAATRWTNYLWHGRAKKTDHWKNQFSSYVSAVGSFSSLWESINGEGSWNANPWVWVVEFKRVEKARDQ